MTDALFVPIIESRKPLLYRISVNDSEFPWRVNGRSIYPALKKKLRSCFPDGKVALGLKNVDSGELFGNDLDPNTSSVNIAVYLAIFQYVKNRKLKTKWDSITITGDIKPHEDDDVIELKAVSEIKAKYHAVESYANADEHQNKHHLFVYINDREPVEVESGKHGNIEIKRFSPRWFLIDDVINYIFESKGLIPGFKLFTGAELTEKDCEDAANIDRFVYDFDDKDENHDKDKIEEKQWDAKDGLDLIKRNPEVYWMLKDIVADRVVAYANLSPLGKDDEGEAWFDKIKTGKWPDSRIPKEAYIPYRDLDICRLLFCSIAIDPDYENKGLTLNFIDEIVRKIISLKNDRGIIISDLIADAITENGHRLCKFFGMKPMIQNEETGSTITEYGSTIYTVRFVPPEFNQITESVTRLYEIYKDIDISKFEH